MTFTEEDWNLRAITMAKKWVARDEVDFDADDILYICKALISRDEALTTARKNVGPYARDP